MTAGTIVVEADRRRLIGDLAGGCARFASVPYAALTRLAPPIPLRADTTEAVDCRGPFTVPPQTPPPQLPPSVPPASMVRIDGDGLYCSVWAPEGASNAPVVVWVVGGGFSMCWPAFDHDDVAQFVTSQGMVVVALTYRVDFWGCAELRHRGGKLRSSGNLALRDVIHGLEWVQRSIAAFGGDPRNVTVAGHSAGAFLSAAAVSTAPPRTLCRRLALLSGGASRLIPLDRAVQTTEAVLARLDPGDNAEQVLHAPTQRLQIGRAHV